MLSKLQSVPRASVNAESLTECELFLFSRPADFHFQAESSKMETPGSVFAGSLERVVGGSVHVCTHSIVFEPKNGRLPLCRIPIWKDFALQRTGVGDRSWSSSALNFSNDRAQVATTCDVKIFINEAWELFETQSSVAHKWPAGTWVKLSVSLDDASAFCDVARLASRIHCAMRSAWDIWMPLLVQHLNTLLQVRFSDTRDLPVHCESSSCHSLDAAPSEHGVSVCNLDSIFLGYRILPLIVEAVGIKFEADHFVSQPLHQEVNAGAISISLGDVAMVVPRAWRLRHTAFEIYVRVPDVGQGCGLKLPNRFRLWQGFLFDVGSTKMRDACIEKLNSTCPNLYSTCVQRATQEWEEHGMSNYEYLLFLNFVSGRTFNDLTQYPVMPWTRIDFEPRNKLAPVSANAAVALDASDNCSAPSRRAEVFRSFRDLSKNVGALSALLLAKAKERLLDMREGEPRFLFGSHFSTPMYVVYFLVRIYPKFMMRFTSGTFDLPDRLFHSVADTWKGVVNNPSDQKELIPEFYDSDGSFLCNTLRVDLGTRQDGVKVWDVRLPPWASSPIEFVNRMREGLETSSVNDKLHFWIDLTFGFGQRGKAAELCDNIFHPITMADVDDLRDIQDPVRRLAMEVQAVEFGRMPQQLFFRPHKPRLPAPTVINEEFTITQGLKAWTDELMVAHGVVEDCVSGSAVPLSGVLCNLIPPVSSEDGLPISAISVSEFANIISNKSSMCVGIIGPAGAGKSWCLNRMYLDICNLLLQQEQSLSDARLPILIYADVFVHRCGCSYVSYLKFLHGDSQGCHIACSAVRKGRAVLLVDGLEEAKKEVDIYRTIDALGQLAAFGCNIVLTSRLISSVTAFSSNFPMQLWRIEGMNDMLISAFFQLRNVDAHASSVCRSHPLVRQLCTLPLVASTCVDILSRDSSARSSGSRAAALLCDEVILLLLFRYEVYCAKMRRVSEKSTPSEVVLLKNEGVRFLETLAEVVLIRNHRSTSGHSFSEADVQEAVKLCQDRIDLSSPATASEGHSSCASVAGVWPALLLSSSLIVPFGAGVAADSPQSSVSGSLFQLRQPLLLDWLLIRWRSYRLDELAQGSGFLSSFSGSSLNFKQTSVLLPDEFLLWRYGRSALQLLAAFVTYDALAALVSMLCSRQDHSGAFLEVASFMAQARSPLECNRLLLLLRASGRPDLVLQRNIASLNHPSQFMRTKAAGTLSWLQQDSSTSTAVRQYRLLVERAASEVELSGACSPSALHILQAAGNCGTWDAALFDQLLCFPANDTSLNCVAIRSALRILAVAGSEAPEESILLASEMICNVIVTWNYESDHSDAPSSSLVEFLRLSSVSHIFSQVAQKSPAALACLLCARPDDASAIVFALRLLRTADAAAVSTENTSEDVRSIHILKGFITAGLSHSSTSSFLSESVLDELIDCLSCDCSSSLLFIELFGRILASQPADHVSSLSLASALPILLSTAQSVTASLPIACASASCLGASLIRVNGAADTFESFVAASMELMARARDFNDQSSVERIGVILCAGCNSVENSAIPLVFHTFWNLLSSGNHRLLVVVAKAMLFQTSSDAGAELAGDEIRALLRRRHVTRGVHEALSLQREEPLMAERCSVLASIPSLLPQLILRCGTSISVDCVSEVLKDADMSLLPLVAISGPQTDIMLRFRLKLLALKKECLLSCRNVLRTLNSAGSSLSQEWIDVITRMGVVIATFIQDGCSSVNAMGMGARSSAAVEVDAARARLDASSVEECLIEALGCAEEGLLMQHNSLLFDGVVTLLRHESHAVQSAALRCIVAEVTESDRVATSSDADPADVEQARFLLKRGRRIIKSALNHFSTKDSDVLAAAVVHACSRNSVALQVFLNRVDQVIKAFAPMPFHLSDATKSDSCSGTGSAPSTPKTPAAHCKAAKRLIQTLGAVGWSVLLRHSQTSAAFDILVWTFLQGFEHVPDSVRHAAVVVLSALDLQDSSLRTALEAVAASDTDGLIRLEALLSLVGAGVCNVTIARMLAVLLPQLNLQASIWASKHGIFDAVRVLPCVPEMIQAVATICSNRGSSARLQELLLAAVHSSCVVTDEDAVTLTKMMVDDSDLAQLCVQPLWRYMVKYIQETQRMLPNDMVDLLRNASGLAAAACVALLLNRSFIVILQVEQHQEHLLCTCGSRGGLPAVVCGALLTHLQARIEAAFLLYEAMWQGLVAWKQRDLP